jgi:hypothetical protein
VSKKKKFRRYTTGRLYMYFSKKAYPSYLSTNNVKVKSSIAHPDITQILIPCDIAHYTIVTKKNVYHTNH